MNLSQNCLRSMVMQAAGSDSMGGEIMEELNPARAFEIVNRYLGGGDPGKNGPGIWFVGIEEGGIWGNSDKKEHLTEEQKVKRARKQIEDFAERTKRNWYSCYPTDNSYQPTPTPVFPNMVKIVCRFSASEKDGEKYRKTYLFKEGYKVFLANLYPFAKSRTTEWPDHYKQVFGYGKDEIRLYEEEVENTRFREIFGRWSEHQPQATICLGQEYVPKFKTVFGLQLQFENIHPYILCNESRKILVTQHFSSPHWNRDASEKLEVIATKLNQWEVALP